MEQKRDNIQVANELALLVNVTLPNSALKPLESLAELKSLVEAAGAEVVGYAIQKRRRMHPAHCVGKGKALEIAERAEQYGAGVIIFDNDLSPGQIRELEEITDRKVLDRSEVILDIFASRAKTYTAKLQVDLAQLQYTYPRLTRMWSHLDTVAGAAGGGGIGAVGGIGTRGTGEKQLEIDRRLVNKRLTILRRELENIDRRKQRQVRSRHDVFTVSLVGYTNAGKSSLMNLLTGADTYVKDQLFATLDTKTVRWSLDRDNHVLLSDTVGFIRDLPHHLVASFRATLEETIHADLLVHVVDGSHDHAQLQLESVNKVLAEMDCNEKDILLVFNKIDRAGIASQLETLTTLHPNAFCISAKTGKGVEQLVEVVQERLTGQQLHIRVAYSYTDGKVRSFLQGHGTIISEDYNEDGVVLEAHLGKRQLPGLKRLKPEFCEVLSND